MLRISRIGLALALCSVTVDATGALRRVRTMLHSVDASSSLGATTGSATNKQRSFPFATSEDAWYADDAPLSAETRVSSEPSPTKKQRPVVEHSNSHPLRKSAITTTASTKADDLEFWARLLQGEDYGNSLSLSLSLPSYRPPSPESPPALAPVEICPPSELAPVPPPTENTRPTQCAANAACADAGLTGECCPTTSGVFLDCCAPQQCEVNPGCAGLTGDCCPTDDGVFLECCSDTGDAVPTTPVSLPSSATTPVSLPSSATTPVSMPSSATTPVSLPSSSATTPMASGNVEPPSAPTRTEPTSPTSPSAASLPSSGKNDKGDKGKDKGDKSDSSGKNDKNSGGKDDKNKDKDGKDKDDKGGKDDDEPSPPAEQPSTSSVQPPSPAQEPTRSKEGKSNDDAPSPSSVESPSSDKKSNDKKGDSGKSDDAPSSSSVQSPTVQEPSTKKDEKSSKGSTESDDEIVESGAAEPPAVVPLEPTSSPIRFVPTSASNAPAVPLEPTPSPIRFLPPPDTEDPDTLTLSDAPSTVPSSSSDVPSTIPSVVPTIASTPINVTVVANVTATTAPIEFAAEGSPDDGRESVILRKCGSSVANRTSALKRLMSSVTTSKNATAALVAFEWLDTIDDLIVCADDSTAVQRYILALLYFDTSGNGWTNCRADLSPQPGDCTNGTQWLDGSSECEWFGVTCDISGRVSKLALKENNLQGKLPLELFALVDLVGLSLDHNKIGGRIPEAIGSLTKLTYLELDDNALLGRIPDALYTMSSLKAIDLNKNSLRGTVSNAIGNLTELMVLQVEDNKLTGPLPAASLAALDDMVVMYLHGNAFEGSLDPVCAEVAPRRETNAGYLQYMAADCEANACSCCSQCF